MPPARTTTSRGVVPTVTSGRRCEAAYTSAVHAFAPRSPPTGFFAAPRERDDETVEILLPTLSITFAELETGASAIPGDISYTVYLISAAAVLRGYAGGVGPAAADGIADGSI
jgi:hypothetical protein